MGERLDTGHCPTCAQQRLIRQQRPTHVLHLLLTIFTFGLWGIVWLILASRESPARCTFCGTSMSRVYDPGARTTYWRAQ